MRKLLMVVLLSLPVIAIACDGNEKKNVNFYTALFESKSAVYDYNLKHVASEELTESIMKNISCGEKMVAKKEEPILPDSFLISIEYDNLTY